MYKSLDLGSHDPLTMEPRVSLLDLDHQDASGVKMASELREFTLEIKPKPGKTFLHVIALGAYEYYGANRNKDAFAEKHNGPDAELNLPSVAIGEDFAGLLEQFNGMAVTSKVAPNTRVYETFNSAHAFKHHKNKDPAKKIGDVVKAFYNKDMHRVELIIELHNDKCDNFITRVNRGDRLAFSMGCHIKYDVCSECGNRAPRRSDYCEHARNMHRQEFGPSGRAVCVFNPNARFFDISIVFRPADRIGYMLKKVASHSSASLSADRGAEVEVYNHRRVLAAKLSALDKRISGEVEGVHQSPDSFEVALRAIKPLELDQPDSLDVSDLDDCSFADIIRTASDLHTPLAGVEVAQLAHRRATGGKYATLSKLSSQYTGAGLALIERNPDLLDEMLDAGLFTGAYSKRAELAITKLRPQRGIDRDSLIKQALMAGHKPLLGINEHLPGRSDKPTTEVYHVDTPEGTFVTNRDAVTEAKRLETGKSIAKALGTGALAGGAYRVMTGGGGLGIGLLGSGASAAYDVVRGNSGKALGNTLETREGVALPKNTQLFDKDAALTASRIALLDAKLATARTLDLVDFPSDADFNTTATLLGEMILATASEEV